MEVFLKNKKRLSNGRFGSIGDANPVMPTLKERFESFFEKGDENECWEWQSARLDFGYGVLWANGKNKSAHRLSYELYVGKIPAGLCVLHRCDNPPCVNPNHLFLGTKHDNILDASKKERLVTGVRHHNHKLCNWKVRLARFRFTKGWNLNQLARTFLVDKSTMTSVIRRETWRNV